MQGCLPEEGRQTLKKQQESAGQRRGVNNTFTFTEWNSAHKRRGAFREGQQCPRRPGGPRGRAGPCPCSLESTLRGKGAGCPFSPSWPAPKPETLHVRTAFSPPGGHRKPGLRAGVIHAVQPGQPVFAETQPRRDQQEAPRIRKDDNLRNVSPCLLKGGALTPTLCLAEGTPLSESLHRWLEQDSHFLGGKNEAQRSYHDNS